MLSSVAAIHRPDLHWWFSGGIKSVSLKMASDNGVEEGGVYLRSSSPLRSWGVSLLGDHTLQTFSARLQARNVSMLSVQIPKNRLCRQTKERVRGRWWGFTLCLTRTHRQEGDWTSFSFRVLNYTCFFNWINKRILFLMKPKFQANRHPGTWIWIPLKLRMQRTELCTW